MADGPVLRSKPLGGADCPPQSESESELTVNDNCYSCCIISFQPFMVASINISSLTWTDLILFVLLPCSTSPLCCLLAQTAIINYHTWINPNKSYNADSICGQTNTYCWRRNALNWITTFTTSNNNSNNCKTKNSVAMHSSLSEKQHSWNTDDIPWLAITVPTFGFLYPKRSSCFSIAEHCARYCDRIVILFGTSSRNIRTWTQ